MELCWAPVGGFEGSSTAFGASAAGFEGGSGAFGGCGAAGAGGGTLSFAAFGGAGAFEGVPEGVGAADVAGVPPSWYI
jgi:hypothetical protein